MRTIVVGNRAQGGTNYTLVHTDDGKIVQGASADVENNWRIEYDKETAKSYRIDYVFGQLMARHKGQSIIPFEGIETIDLIDII